MAKDDKNNPVGAFFAERLAKAGKGGIKAEDRTVQFGSAGHQPGTSTIERDSEFLSSFRGKLGSPGKIKSLLAGCTPLHLDGNVTIDFERLLSGLVGAARFLIKDSMTGKTHTVLLAQTARSSFLIYKMPVESLYDIPGLTGAEFKNRCMLRTPDGETLTMSVVSGREIKAVMSISVEDAQASRRAPAALGTIAPQEGSGLVEFKFKLRAAKVLSDASGRQPWLDVKAFADNVKFAAPFAEETGRMGHYVIYFGPEETLYHLYVNSEPPETAGRSVVARLSYNQDVCVLCRD